MHDVEAKGILSAKNGMNIYRGCTHGCIYCDSRSTCYGFEHPFEDVEVKANAPELLEDALRRKRARCTIGTGSMCDPYLPLEAERRLTRKSLEIIDKYGFGLSILTKSDLILRDLDLLKSINQKAKCVAATTLTTFDEDLCRIIESHVCTTRRRYEVLKTMQSEGIPTVVWFCPLLPFINDTEENLLGLLDYCIDAGVRGILNFGMGVTLRDGDREYFYRKLDEHFPGVKEKYIRTYGNAYQCESPNSPALRRLFREVCGKHGIMHSPDEVFAYLTAYEDKAAAAQMSMF